MFAPIDSFEKIIFGSFWVFFDRKKKTFLPMKEKEQDWKEVIVSIVLKILTLGLYHIEKHRKEVK